MSIPFKYDCGYHEYGRIWKRWVMGKYNSFDLTDNGVCLVSPAGKEYRYYGRGGIGYNYGWGSRFYHNNQYRDLGAGTIIRAMMLGWKWVRDKDKPIKKYNITRWPNGNHYYVTDDKDNPIKYLGLNKFNTVEMAELAGQNWQKNNK